MISHRLRSLASGASPGAKLSKIGVLVTLVATVLTFFTGAAFAATQQLTTGPGLHYDGTFVGVYRIGNTAVDCIDPDLAAGEPTGSKIVGSLRGLSRRQVHEVAYFTTKFLVNADVGGSHAKDNGYGAALRISVLKLIGNGVWRKLYNDAPTNRVRTLVNTMVGTSGRLAGPYTTAVRFMNKVTLGVNGKAETFTRARYTKKLVPHQVHRLTGSANVHLPRSATAGKGGIARFGYTPVKSGKVTITSVATVPSTKVRVWHPSGSTFQRFVSAAPKEKVSGSATYLKSLHGPTESYGCNTVCDGNPPVTFQFCNVAPHLYHGLVWVNGKLVATVHVAKATKRHPRQCASTTINIHDGRSVTTGYSMLIGGHWTHSKKFPGTLVIDCPAVELPTESVTADCTSAVVTLSLDNQSADKREIRYRVNKGKEVDKIVAPKSSGSAKIAVDRTKGDTTVYFDGGVWRPQAKQWNVGGVWFSVTVPAAKSSSGSATVRNAATGQVVGHLGMGSSSSC